MKNFTVSSQISMICVTTIICLSGVILHNGLLLIMNYFSIWNCLTDIAL